MKGVNPLVVKRLLVYLKPYYKMLALAFLLLLLGTATDLAGPILLKVFIDNYLTPRLFIKEVLLGMSGLYLLLHISSVFFNYYQLVTFNGIAQKIIQKLRLEVFCKVQSLGMEYFDKTPSGAVVSRITNDTQAIKELFVSVLATLVQSIVYLLGAFMAMFLLDVRLALFCLLILPLLLVLITGYSLLSTRIFRALRETLSKINTLLNEALQNMSIIQALGQEKRLREEFSSLNREYYQTNIKDLKLEALLLRPAVDMINVLTIALLLGYFGWQSLRLPVEIGVLYAFLNYVGRFYEPINMLLSKLPQFQQSLVASRRVFELLDEERLSPQQEGTDNPRITAGRVEFKGVSFAYDGKNEVLQDISFQAAPGQTVALVGHTGSGKSTIANLLMRFYTLEKGEISIDGAPLQSFGEQELRAKMSLVLQEPLLFYGSIEDNIRFHHPRLSEGELREAAALAQAEDFIGKLPHQYEETVGERGLNLSAGQRQLLSYARAMAVQPKILVLDEATSSVDTETEEAIQLALQKMRLGRTTIVIAHRLSTIQDADLILVLSRGRIVERGSHQELLKQKGLYYKMYLLQQGRKDL